MRLRGEKERNVRYTKNRKEVIGEKKYRGDSLRYIETVQEEKKREKVKERKRYKGNDKGPEKREKAWKIKRKRERQRGKKKMVGKER